MKIKCYDKYNKQHLIINLSRTGDEIYCNAFASMYAIAGNPIYFEIDNEYYKEHPDEYAEDPDPKRWSDLIDFKIIK